MAESTLVQQRSDLLRQFGLVFSLGRDSSVWTANTLQDVTDMIDEGSEVFYRADGKHKWHFLWLLAELTVFADIAITSGDFASGAAYADPITTVTISGGNTTMYPGMVGRSIVITGVGTFVIAGYTSSTVITVTGDASAADGTDTFSITTDGFFRLPDNVAAVDGPIYFDEDETNRLLPIPLVSHGQILQYRSRSDFTGFPQAAALVPSITGQTAQAKTDLYFFPDISGTYVLDYKYRIRPDALTTTLTHFFGSGGEHDQTFKYACLAAYERLIDENPNGPVNQTYRELLASSIEFDKRALRPEFMGRLSTDQSVSLDKANDRNLRGTIKFNGSAIP